MVILLTLPTVSCSCKMASSFEEWKKRILGPSQRADLIESDHSPSEWENDTSSQCSQRPELHAVREEIAKLDIRMKTIEAANESNKKKISAISADFKDLHKNITDWINEMEGQVEKRAKQGRS
ncbi:hypothetical protein PISL3812_09982 [Talaromyces islandicus]|uniref:Uncharacterized protein n=1 Tax=Talaromyces islandicus TaxID=28573 RepID=A0A0U1MBH6_TALIS|nr:hypothetical protein PISL3812_09982 [Talaromyces islandicus]